MLLIQKDSIVPMRNTQNLLLLLLCLSGMMPNSFLLGQKVEVEHELEADSLVFYLVNYSYMPLYITVNVNDRTPADSRMYSDFVLPAKGERAKFLVVPVLQPSDTAELLQGSFGKVQLQHGDPLTVKPDGGFQYGLPFQRKKSYKLIQGFKGSFTHNKPNSMFALDFAMPIGDEVCAARAGRVVKVKEDSKEGGPSAKYKGKDNHVVVLHEDGTLAYYVHLQYEGALVEEGQEVALGDVLGFAGNTGYSTRPHLHFVVRKPTLEGPVSIPFRFQEYSYQQ